MKYGPALAVLLGAVLIASALGSAWPLPTGLLVASLVWRAVERMTTTLGPFLERVRIPKLLGLPLLIVRAPDDEASLALAALQGANRLMSFVWRVVCLEWVGVAWRLVGRTTERWADRSLLGIPLELWIGATVLVPLCVFYYLSESTQQAAPLPSMFLGGPVFLMFFVSLSLVFAALRSFQFH